MLQIVDAMKNVKKGIIEVNGKGHKFEMLDCETEWTLYVKYLLLKGDKVIKILGNHGEYFCFNTDIIRDFDFHHFKMAYVMYEYFEFLSHCDRDFQRSMYNYYQIKYKFTESIMEIVFYMLNHDEISTFGFAPIYANYNHFLGDLVDMGIPFIYIKPNFKPLQHIEEIIVPLKDEFTKVKELDSLALKMENFIAILRSMSSINERRFFKNVRCDMKIKVKSNNRLIYEKLHFEYLTPHEIINSIYTSKGLSFEILKVEELSVSH